PHSAVAFSPYVLSGDRHVVFPKNLAHRQVVSLADIENTVWVENLCASDCFYHHVLFFGPQQVAVLKKMPDPRIRKHTWVLLCLFRIERRLRKHVMKHSADACERVENYYSNAGTQRICDQKLLGRVAERHIRHSDYPSHLRLSRIK